MRLFAFFYHCVGNVVYGYITFVVNLKQLCYNLGISILFGILSLNEIETNSSSDELCPFFVLNVLRFPVLGLA
ncbi:hypothetical protein KDAU_66300 [Dictyobacter aurantiacus]|uniref:Uncharacterized protein n=1 Tax=Dictyobacter aurantiacus TaxID=1936993 RepID=A0A401ZR06_9CHLR|nr:hypothetical protein KDAU_66300 [Dictyobacter aurantiacus]